MRKQHNSANNTRTPTGAIEIAADALSYAESGFEAKVASEEVLVLIAKENPNLRLQLYKKVGSRARQQIGPMLSIKQVVERLENYTRLRNYFEGLVDLLKVESPNDPIHVLFRPDELHRKGLSRLNSDKYRQELKKLDLIKTSRKMCGRYPYLRLSARGLLVAKKLEDVSS